MKLCGFFTSAGEDISFNPVDCPRTCNKTSGGALTLPTIFQNNTTHASVMKFNIGETGYPFKLIIDLETESYFSDDIIQRIENDMIYIDAPPSGYSEVGSASVVGITSQIYPTGILTIVRGTSTDYNPATRWPGMFAGTTWTIGSTAIATGYYAAERVN
jgi:hypothetical protein